jgi:hypothetical protein
MLIVAQRVKEFPVFYGNRKFIVYKRLLLAPVLPAL